MPTTATPSTPRRSAAQRPIRRAGRVRTALHAMLLGAAWIGFVASVHATTPLANQPLFTNTAVPGNLALALSVEWPTVSRAAHPANSYVTATTYLGYFDPKKCYLYHAVAPETDTEVSHFYPSRVKADRNCNNAGEWSGNFLNWATMIAIDPFRWALTGGYRRVDTPSTTILERARHSGQGSLFPNREITTGVGASTPFGWGRVRMRVNGAGTRMIFTGSTGTDLGGTPTAFTPGSSTDTTLYAVEVRVKVCDPALGVAALESNCQAYGSNYKPEGLVQEYATRMRLSAFGYLNDGNGARDGGVLRARQKFVGPEVIVPGSTPIANPAAEWSATTGVFAVNPNPADASALGDAVPNSGVINYLNKFGQLTSNTHKDFDPVSELYYAVTRYFRNLGNVPEWTAVGTANAATRARWADQFPVITAWDDPIQYSCQRNFVLGIGDIYTHRDKNLPGNGTGTADEPAKPEAVRDDTGVNSVTETAKAFALVGLAAPNNNNYSGRNNSAGMVGLAYHANTRDLRPDLPGKQTMQTYWVDVLEAPFVNNNQFLLAAKLGGFNVPEGFDPLSFPGPLPEAWWHTTGDLLPGGVKRPDNYFTAGAADTMINGLSQAFASIAAALQAYTTSFSTSLPQVSISGNASYSAQFDSQNWTGELVASELSFSPTDGTPSLTTAWSFSNRLSTQLGGTGWNTGRRMVTWNPSTGAGVAFRHGTISDPQRIALNTPWRGIDDSADFLNYLRGDRLHEQGSTVAGSSKAYRNRAGLMGDVVGSKARPVGPPSMPWSNASNPGYSSFKSTRATRPTVVYVGANAGVLHAIDGRLTGATAGREIFAYVPSALFRGPDNAPQTSGLAALGNPAYEHRNYVNATPGAFDIDMGRTAGGSGTDWRTLLIGGLGKGGRSIYAIDVTDPDAMTTEAAVASKVMWEFSDPDLGYTFGEPLVVKTKKYGWVVLIGSGHNNSNGQGYFFIINPRTGALLEKVGTGAGSAGAQAGLAHVNAFSLDRTDGTVDAAYAGDLLGNLWRLDLTPLTGSYAAPLKLAALRSQGGDVQSVTTRPMIEVDPRTGRRFVLVGTGRMLDSSDIGSTVQQSFYAIVDGKSTAFAQVTDLPGTVTYPIQRSHLADNTNLLDDISYDPATQIGWTIELGAGGAGGSVGWRVVNDPTAAFGIVAFASTLPSGDVCNPSGSTRIYAVNFGTGRSVLVSGPDTFISYSTALSSVVTDLRFFSVNGVARLIAGSDTGELGSINGVFGVRPGVRRLNWRELPVAQ